MKHLTNELFLIPIFVIFGVISAYQNAPKQTLIVDGWSNQYWSNEVNREGTYYLWDGNKTVEVKSRQEMLNRLYRECYNLICSYNYVIGAIRYETWIFEK